MEAYEAGTVCVITRTRPNYIFNLGETVVCGKFSFIWWSGSSVDFDGTTLLMRRAPEINGMKMQIVRYTTRITVWPVEWMRPIDKDTGPDDLEVIRRMNENTPVFLPS